MSDGCCLSPDLHANFFLVDVEEFKREAARALDRLPKHFRRQLHNVAIVVEKKATKSQLREMGLDPEHDDLYGLYQGVPLADRSVFNPPVLPDKITLFCEPLIRDFPDPKELRGQIRRTVVHEIAHFFGMDDEEIEDLGY
jgi:predicted Zn-dependent protease with MMP-like domain